MLLILNLPQEQVIAAAEAWGVVGCIGPTSASGWTTMGSTEGAEPDLGNCPARYLAITQTDDGLQMDVFPGVGDFHRRVWLRHPDGCPAEQVKAERMKPMAAALSEMFGCSERHADLEDLLGRETLDADGLVDSLDSMLDLPDLIEMPPVAGVVAHRGDRALARLGASIAGPAYLSTGPDGWTFLLACGEGEIRCIQLAAGVSGTAKRREPVFLLWRDEAASGWQLWRGGPRLPGGLA